MIPTYVLDAGALIAAERGKMRVARFFRFPRQRVERQTIAHR